MAPPLVAPLESVRPDIVFYDYTNGIYKIVRHKSTAPRVYCDPDKFNHYDHKLDPSLSRSRRTVLELALCNEWAYFCTFTLSPEKNNRQDLNQFHKRLTQWLRDQRKVHLKKGYDIPLRFVLVPELHADGKTWHMHGLFSDISPVLVSFRDLWNQGMKVPYKLVEKNYCTWPAYWKTFGFCSFGRIKNSVACGFYITKYITKELSKNHVDLGCSLYYSSRPLNHAKKHGEIYGYTKAFDKWLVNHYDFCDTGMTHVKDGLDWSFGLEYMNYDLIEAVSLDSQAIVDEVNDYTDSMQQAFDQMSLEEFTL